MRFEGLSTDRAVVRRLNLIIVLQSVILFLMVLIWLIPKSPSREPVSQLSKGIVPPETSQSKEGEIDALLSNKDREMKAVIEPQVPSSEEEFKVIRVQVLNGCGVPGIAKRARDWLVRRNFEVRDMGNADRMDYAQTIIIDRTGDIRSARKIADLLNLPSSRISTRLIPSGLDFEVTLVIGKDYKQLPFAR